MKKFLKDEPTRILLLVHRLTGVIHYFVSSFLVIYFLKITDWDIRLVALNGIVGNIVNVLFFYILGTKLTKSNITKFYKAGTLLKALYAIIIILLGVRVKEYIVPLGALWGMAMALYWIPRHYMIYRFNTVEKSKKFFGLEGAFEKIEGVLTPILMGGIISYATDGYLIVALILGIVVSMAFIISNYLEFEGEAIENSSYSKMKSYLTGNEIKNMKNIYIADFSRNISRTSFSKVFAALVYLEYGSEFGLGSFKAVVAISLGVLSLIVSKSLKSKNRNQLLIIAGLGIVFPMILLLYNVSEVTLMLYSILTGVGFVILNIIKGTTMMEIVKNDNFKKYTLENIIVREAVMNFARIIGYLGLLIVGNIKENIWGLKMFFAFIILTNIVTVIGIYVSGNNKDSEELIAN
ncbi:MAG: hypothetical protein N4A47_01875 [Clostridia bacterium]|jgi:hypothetical protein|nr:hypothetical protein [Clostridia bacterium]